MWISVKLGRGLGRVWYKNLAKESLVSYNLKWHRPLFDEKFKRLVCQIK